MKKIFCLFIITCSCWAFSLELQEYKTNLHPYLIKRIELWIGKIEKEESSSFKNILKLGEVVLPYLEKGLDKDYSVEIKKNIIKIVEQLRSEKGIKILIQCLENSNYAIRVREQAAVTLGNMGYSEALPSLYKYSTVRDARIYRSCVQSICRIKNVEAIPYLLELLRHWESEVTEKSHQSLVSITNKSLPANYQAWKEWWDENSYKWQNE